MYPEAELLPISALQHLLFCERQTALIHVERLWAENRLTTEGRHLHEKTHGDIAETRGRVRIVRGLQLQSQGLGLYGVADVVEFEPPEGTSLLPSLIREIAQGKPMDWAGWRITPIEYKRGKPKTDDSDRVQLCAQAVCLEEMLSVRIPSGGLFYGQRRRRTDVNFDEELRINVKRAADRFRELIETGETPPAIRETKCDSCSLASLCLPDATNGRRRVRRFVENQLNKHHDSTGPLSD